MCLSISTEGVYVLSISTEGVYVTLRAMLVTLDVTHN
jgi:hypothetical protein